MIVHFTRVTAIILFIALSKCGAAQSFIGIPESHKVLLNKIYSTREQLSLAFQSPGLHSSGGISNHTREAYLNSGLTLVDSLVSKIQSRLGIDTTQQTIYLRGLFDALQDFYFGFKAKEFNSLQFKYMLEAYQASIILQVGKRSILPVIRTCAIPVCRILVANSAFKLNPGIQEATSYLVRKIFQTNPKDILPALFDHPDVLFADSIIKTISRSQVEKLYTYAQATNSVLGQRINRINDPLVQMIVKLSGLKMGQYYLPFLDDLLAGKIMISGIDKALTDTTRRNYYKLLVTTKIGYTKKFQQHDTALVDDLIIAMMKRVAVTSFIRVMNDLHSAPDIVRLKVLRGLDTRELYYLLVLGENDLYTSTYLKIYKRLFSQLKERDSYQLLNSVNFDRLLKMIKMAANYNTLNDLLSSMRVDRAEQLISSIADGLQNTGALENAVDVADTYASISNPIIRKKILEGARRNLETLTTSGDSAGIKLYALLYSVLVSNNQLYSNNIPSQFGIPSLTLLRNDFLKDSSGTITIQQFFYGDKDGRSEFNHFMHAYHQAGWKVEMHDEWVKVYTAKGTPVCIYSNLPLNDTTELDAASQAHLITYLNTKNIYPSIVIHRGHSYHVVYTIQQLPPSAKLVLLGSCGGYNNISGILNLCPYAHIIATKQEGSGTINLPVMMRLTALLNKGKDLFWPQIWNTLTLSFKNNPRFQEYIPPHKNLGALFLMAYKKAVSTSGISK